jgi:hypothetical protein
VRVYFSIVIVFVAIASTAPTADKLRSLILPYMGMGGDAARGDRESTLRSLDDLAGCAVTRRC